MAYRGSTSADTGSATSPTLALTVPGAVVADDFGVLLVTWVGTAGETPPTVGAESGTGLSWSTLKAPTTANNMGYAVLSRQVVTGDAGTVTITVGPFGRFLTAVAVWYSNVTAAGVVGTATNRAGVSGTTTTALSITLGAAGRDVLACFAERSTTAGTTVSVNAGTVRVYREGAGTTTVSALISDLTSATGVSGDITATYSTAAGNGAGLQVELVPAVATPPPGDASTPGFADGFGRGLGAPVVITPPGPPGPAPAPVPAAGTGGTRPAAWTWVLGSWRTGPDTLLSKARNRRVTWRRTGRSEASFDLDGRGSAATAVDVLVDDLWIIRAAAPGLGRTLFRGRVGPTADTLDADSHAVTVTAGDYRRVLERRQLWEGGQLSWLNVDQAAIAWGLVQHTQTQPGGALGIVRGVGQSTGKIRARNDYPPGKSVAESVDQLAQVEDGFDWDVTPHADPRNPTLYLDVFFPGRGSDRGAVLDYGGRVIAAARQVDPGQYANAVRGTGADSTSTGGTLAPVRREAADLISRPEGRWDGEMSDPDLTVQQTIVDRTVRALTTRQVISPAWTVTLRPNSWGGPDDLWLGDPVLLVVKSGRLDVVESLQVEQIACAWDEEDNVTTAVELAAVTRPGRRWSLRQVDQRLRALERR